MKKLLFFFIIISFSIKSGSSQFIYPLSEYSATDDEIEISKFDIKDTLLFLPLGNKSLQILNIADLHNITEVSKFEEYEIRYNKKAYGKAYDVKVVGNKAFLAYGELGLKIIDITDPTMTYSIGTYYRHHDVNCVEIYENYALLGFVDLGLEIVDYSNLDDILMVSRNNILGFTIENIQIIPPYIIISGGSRGLYTFKFLEPFTNFKSTEFPRGFVNENEFNKLIVRGTVGYLANDFRGLSVLNIKLPLYPLEVLNIKTKGKAVDLAIDRNYLYVLSSKAIEVYDIKDPEKPEKIFEYAEKDKKYNNILIKDSNLFVSYTLSSEEYGIQVFQIE
ncbi:MAG: hypothetical protein A2041_08520 [Bacteroidetes bacterium GWA2_31_9b]|nr:MAG: hypothetical protein A2041_08520 [Bacteroidetes bacterium GWA2_31_9b]